MVVFMGVPTFLGFRVVVFVRDVRRVDVVVLVLVFGHHLRLGSSRILGLRTTDRDAAAQQVEFRSNFQDEDSSERALRNALLYSCAVTGGQGSLG